MFATRRAVLQALKSLQSATVNDLAAQVGVKAITIRHHLNALQADGWVEVEEKRQQVGRPLYLYALSEQGRDLFPQSFDVLCPYYPIGQHRVEACDVDKSLLETLGAEAESWSCLLAGDAACTYLILNS